MDVTAFAEYLKQRGISEEIVAKLAGCDIHARIIIYAVKA